MWMYFTISDQSILLNYVKISQQGTIVSFYHTSDCLMLRRVHILVFDASVVYKE